MIKSAINHEILSKDAIYESLVSFKRAGANAIVTYFSEDIAKKFKIHKY